MMKHDEENLRLTAALDGELGVEGSLELQASLAKNPSLQDAWERQRALRSAIRERAVYHEMPAPLKARLGQMISTANGDAVSQIPSKPPRAGRVVNEARRRWTFAAAGALAGAILGAGITWRGLIPGTSADEAQRIAEDAVAGHVRAALSGRLVDVASADQHTVKPWLSANLPFAPQVPDLSAHGFELVGARRDVIEGELAAVLVYRRRQHVISAFLRPLANPPAEQAVRRNVVRGFNVVSFSRGSAGFWIVSDLNAHDLGDFTDLLTAGIW
jgi:anti-sigma factor RsiW